MGYAVPRWRERLRWPLGLLGVVSAVLIWLTATSGSSLKDDRFATATGLLAQRIQHHEDLAGTLQVVTYVFAGLAVATFLLHYAGRRTELPRWLHTAGYALTGLAAIAVVVYCVLTGDAGAKAAWGA